MPLHSFFDDIAITLGMMHQNDYTQYYNKRKNIHNDI